MNRASPTGPWDRPGSSSQFTIASFVRCSSVSGRKMVPFISRCLRYALTTGGRAASIVICRRRSLSARRLRFSDLHGPAPPHGPAFYTHSLHGLMCSLLKSGRHVFNSGALTRRVCGHGRAVNGHVLSSKGIIRSPTSGRRVRSRCSGASVLPRAPRSAPRDANGPVSLMLYHGADCGK